MAYQIQNIPVPPQIGSPYSTRQQLDVPQRTGIKELVTFLGQLQVFSTILYLEV